MTQDFTLFSKETPWDVFSFDTQTALRAPSSRTKLMVGHEHESFHPLGTVAFILKPVFSLLKMTSCKCIWRQKRTFLFVDLYLKAIKCPR